MSCPSSIRRQVLRRDGHVCQDCGVFVAGRYSDLPTAHIHHIDEDSKNHALDNLVALCRDCHNDRHEHYIPDGPEDPTATANYGADNGQWKGGRYTAPNGYVYVKCPGHPDADPEGYVAEHRLVAANELGRELKENEVVHHKNEDRGDNRPANLEVVTRREHYALHRSEDSDLRHPGEPNPEIECACGCGWTLKKYDESNRPREYIHGHNGKEQEAPTQAAILEVLREADEPVRTKELIETIDTTDRGVKSAQAALRDKGKIASPQWGYWTISSGGTGGVESDD